MPSSHWWLGAAEGVVAGSVVAGAAGELAVGVLFGGAFGASVDVEPDHGLAGVDGFLRDVELVEGVGVGGVAELPDEGGDLVVGGGGVVTRVKEPSGVWWKSLKGGGGVVGRGG